MSELLDVLDRTRSPYVEGGRFSLVGDLYQALYARNLQARGRLDLHTKTLELRAASTTTLAQGVVPPSWMTEQFMSIKHARRALADTVVSVPVDSANPMLIGSQNAGAVVEPQTAENDEPAEGDFEADAVPVVPRTLSGKVRISRQLLDGASPAIDSLIYADCEGALGETIETLVVGAVIGAAKVVTVPAPGAGATLVDSLVTASVAVRNERRLAPTVVACSHTDWGRLAAAKDDAGRPLITTGRWTWPAGSFGVGDAITFGHVDGEAAGMAIVSSGGMPTGRLFVFHPSDVLLFESNARRLRFDDTDGAPATVVLASWSYGQAVVGRFGPSVAEVLTQ
jgi:hypothetical protein